MSGSRVTELFVRGFRLIESPVPGGNLGRYRGQWTECGKTSDLLVNGVSWDVYTPKIKNVDRIVSAVASKGSQVQGGRVIIDLSQTSVTADQLVNIQARVANTGGHVGQIVVMS
jgi:contact-dependent growth inhibition (CDI) system CdiA-like toxin